MDLLLSDELRDPLVGDAAQLADLNAPELPGADPVAAPVAADVQDFSSLIGRYGATLAVDGLSFTVRPGLVTRFLGPNGAGTTTTIRLILGLDRPTGGEATVGGRRYQDLGT